MIIEIDNQSGFCFGVTRAIEKVETLLETDGQLFCLGEIVHNREEVDRLSSLGMETVDHDQIARLNGKKVLLRSHGEPPSTYQFLKKNNNTIVDATCPVVLKLQERVKKSYETMQSQNGQLVIFGKEGHPEVIGLMGQTDDKAILVHSVSDLDNIDFSRPIEVYSQTTMSIDSYRSVCSEMEKRAESSLKIHDTICRQVANRVPRMEEFSKKHDLILFVSGKNSSNGKALFEVCLKNNPRSFFIASSAEIEDQWFENVRSVGICGATSTPRWLMENIKDYVRATLNL